MPPEVLQPYTQCYCVKTGESLVVQGMQMVYSARTHLCSYDSWKKPFFLRNDRTLDSFVDENSFLCTDHPTGKLNVSSLSGMTQSDTAPMINPCCSISCKTDSPGRLEICSGSLSIMDTFCHWSKEGF